MFKGLSVADFEVDGHRAQFMIDNAMPVACVQAILNKLMHFCVERQKEAENEIAQQKADEEAARATKLEAEPAPEADEEVK